MTISGPPRPREDGKCWGDGTPIMEGDLPEPWGTHAADRWIRLMLSTRSSALFRVDGTGASGEGLFSPGLDARIAAWADAYDAWDQRHNGGSGSPPECRPDFPFHVFDSEGEAIAALIRDELPGWKIFHQHCWCPMRF